MDKRKLIQLILVSNGIALLLAGLLFQLGSSTAIALQATPAPTQDRLRDEDGRRILDREALDDLFAAQTGLPRFVLWEADGRPHGEVLAHFARRIVAQRAASEAVAEVVTTLQQGLNDPHKPIASMLLIGNATMAATPGPAAEAEIAHLLSYLETSGCEFYRNGSWHDAKNARAHLQKKRDHLLKRSLIGSAEDFIDRAATSSSVTGQEYRVRWTGYVAQLKLANFTQGSRERFSFFGLRIIETRKADIRLILQIWNTIDGTIAWEGAEELSYATDTRFSGNVPLRTMLEEVSGNLIAHLP